MDSTGPRYADCPTVEVEVIVDAATPVVWPLIADIELPARFSSEFRGAAWLDGVTGPSLGARFLGTNVNSVAGSWQTVCTVVDYVPERRFGYVVNAVDRIDLERPAAAWRYELEPVLGERARLRYLARVGPGPSLLTRVIAADPAGERHIVADRLANLRRNMLATVHGVKDIAEH
ncbi:SRPBCC family protein [Actinophytocola algeriensis]|uniref:Polyketide cyclase/dehydrase/lipid transport protein n=1 Tax=Actinophytocola algeriensis TaxID=1768010 RepID=A0A7W7QDA6_9PSEU|nr:SRPBCC family protein [Actinophytocola algeriensis]MBB4911525.1 hypothetical protein [Actinophytocola algeriensis]MBE1473487.1 hypothetical protein [Actinophytocola algeriensis]